VTRGEPHVVTIVGLLPADRKEAIASSIRRGVSAARVARARSVFKGLIPRLEKLGITAETIAAEVTAAGRAEDR